MTSFFIPNGNIYYFLIFIAIIAVSYIFIYLVWSLFPSNPKPVAPKPVQRGYTKTLIVRCWKKKKEGDWYYQEFADFVISDRTSGIYFNSECYMITDDTPVDFVIKVFFANKNNILYLFKYCKISGEDVLKLETLDGCEIEILKSEE